jgi:hypothetical protein
MSAPLILDDRRQVPTVAIIGNDAVLTAAPATPVQLAHACMRRGFSVAIPASWGDELIASEAMRRLASRERGPAVLCVCPFVRSRLLAPGPDLAPFLVSLVPPPVATARYLRTVYGEHGVHITYVGGCPGAEDSSIDARLTPVAFLADLADHGIALAEQPLVFDSIVPPDRRRWCSLPGGSPTAEVLWSEADARTLIEIERDDASTELAQHIIGHEHVLLDLAPALGCVCSGAISAVPARSARVAVTAVEPPRALGPIVDPTLVVSLDVPVTVAKPDPLRTPARPVADRVDVELMERRLDQLLGTQLITADEPVADANREVESTARSGVADVAPAPSDDIPVVATEPLGSGQNRPVAAAESTPLAEGRVAAAPVTPSFSEPTGPGVTRTDTTDQATQSATPRDDFVPELSNVRRRTPAPMHTRHATSSIPMATASDGRALPRAYVAKRRTPPAGMSTVGSSPESTVPQPALAENTRPTTNSAMTDPPAASPTITPPAAPDVTPDASPVSQTGGRLGHDAPVVEVAGPHPEPPAQTASSTAETGPIAAPNSARVPPNNGASRESAPQPKANHHGGAAAASAPNPGAFVVLLLALIALAIFVLRSLR